MNIALLIGGFIALCVFGYWIIVTVLEFEDETHHMRDDVDE